MIEACGEIVARDDPVLHSAALFAAEPARTRQMVLYAFDCELSRATAASRESMIPRMRLQWWRDVLTRAQGPDPAPAHEVAGPLTALIRSDPSLLSDMEEFPGADVLSRMVDGYEAELEAPFSEEDFATWADNRFGARLALAGSILPASDEHGRAADRSAAPKMLALGLAFRTAVRMARDHGRCFVPGIQGAEIAALGRGELPEDLAKKLSDRAKAMLKDLKKIRSERGRLRGPALAAHLPILREERAVRLVARRADAILGQIDQIDRPFNGLRLAFKAWRGRW